MPLYMRRALEQQRTAEVVYFLGDGLKNIDSLRPMFSDKHFVTVCGNCDLGENALSVDVRSVGVARIFATHGHLYSVKSGIYSAVCAAREQKANVLLFGHTHTPLEDYDDGLYILNPGSISGANPTYGVIDVTDAGIVTNIIHIN